MIALHVLDYFPNEITIKINDITTATAHQMVMLGQVLYLIITVYLPKPSLLDKAQILE